MVLILLQGQSADMGSAFSAGAQELFLGQRMQTSYQPQQFSQQFFYNQLTLAYLNKGTTVSESAGSDRITNVSSR